MWWTGKNHSITSKTDWQIMFSAGHFCKFKVVEYQSQKGPRQSKDTDPGEIQLIKICVLLTMSFYWVEHGKQYESVAFAHFVEQHTWRALQNNIIIGGAYGFSMIILRRDNQLLSFSKFTFPQLIRLIFAEQLYRPIPSIIICLIIMIESIPYITIFLLCTISVISVSGFA
ncbi:MAG: 23S rRNA (pseudouridine(1915)-N(3))-methyltransferase RlmH [Bacteroidetes bacterium]|nr:23S rRNA (pseudouridine(1915)-N(3))-methyltransferase RlmH [Bacteroidota bacterium]